MELVDDGVVVAKKSMMPNQITCSSFRISRLNKEATPQKMQWRRDVGTSGTGQQTELADDGALLQLCLNNCGCDSDEVSLCRFKVSLGVRDGGDVQRVAKVERSDEMNTERSDRRCHRIGFEVV